MWGGLAAAVVVDVAALFAPALVALFALRVRPAIAVAAAPAATVAFLTALSTAYAALGVSCSWAALFVPSAFVALAVAAVSLLVRRVCGLPRAERAPAGGSGAPQRPASATERVARICDRACAALWPRFAIALAVGLAAGVLVFLRSLDGPASFVQEYDNVHHLAQIKAYLETGDWSPFSSTLYPLSADAALDPMPSGSSFYPSAWHLVAAFGADAVGVSVTVAANAATFVFGFVVFPVSMWAFLEAVFAKRPTVVVLGSCAALAFGAFPYGFLTFGPLYPNLASFSFVPAAAAALVSAFDAGLAPPRRAGRAVLFAICLAAVVCAQPNGAFTLGVLSMFFLAMQSGRAARSRAARAVPSDRPEGARRARMAWALGATGFLALCAVAWVALFNAPFLQAVVTHVWEPFADGFQAAANAALLAVGSSPPSVLLAALVFAGAAFTLYRREYAWITCSWACSALLYVVCSSLDGPIKQLLAGFWYADSSRISALLVLAAAPLAGLGLYGALRAARAGLARLASSCGTDAAAPRCAIAVVAGAFAVAAYYPSVTFLQAGTVENQTAAAASQLEELNRTTGDLVYDEAERAFVREAVSLIPDDAIVLNEPNDGSAFAYCVDDLRVVYRYLRGYGGAGETEESRVIRESLADIASDPRVAEAVRSLGADYLIQLDAGDDANEHAYLFSYEPEQWRGIDSVRDDTPGFEVVLARDDMRLYRIVA